MRERVLGWACSLGAATVALSASLSLAAVAPALPGRPQEPSGGSPAEWLDSPEELKSVLERWADEYVRYLITDEELRIYESLATPEQKLAFIERFWELRDPTPGTPENEYREQHLERFAFATRMFAAGKPGWATDRGRIYTILGPPNQIQRNPTGRGAMERASETWTYNAIDNPRLPASLDLDFVDFHSTGEYELVTDIDATAPIWSGQFGYVHSNLDAYALRRHADTLYNERLQSERPVDPALIGQQYLEFAWELREIERVPEIHLARLRSLRESVEATVRFDAVSLDSALAFFEAEGRTTALEVTVALGYEDLQPTEFGGQRHYSADLYAALRVGQEVVAEEERRLNFSLAPQEWERLRGTRILQPFQLIVPPGTYELVVIARDNATDKLGRTLETISIPNLSAPGLRLSSLTLASQVERTTTVDGSERPFQHGDLRVVPNVGAAYYPDQVLQVYFQAYGLRLDPAENTNRVILRGRIERQGTPYRDIPTHYPYPAPKERMAFSLGIPLRGFPPGEYTVALEVADEIAGTSASVSAPFRLLPPESTRR